LPPARHWDRQTPRGDHRLAVACSSTNPRFVIRQEAIFRSTSRALPMFFAKIASCRVRRTRFRWLAGILQDHRRRSTANFAGWLEVKKHLNMRKVLVENFTKCREVTQTRLR